MEKSRWRILGVTHLFTREKIMLNFLKNRKSVVNSASSEAYDNIIGSSRGFWKKSQLLYSYVLIKISVIFRRTWCHSEENFYKVGEQTSQKGKQNLHMSIIRLTTNCQM